jgi:hypothetical protein
MIKKGKIGKKQKEGKFLPYAALLHEKWHYQPELVMPYKAYTIIVSPI